MAEEFQNSSKEQQSPESPKSPQSPSEWPEPPNSNQQFPPGPPSNVVKIQNAIAASQITALISFLIGGAILGGVSVFLALKARKNLKELSGTGVVLDQLTALKLERGTKLALGMAVIAFALNLALAITFYPVVLSAVESGDFGSIFEFADSGSASSAPKSSSSVWG